MTASARDAGSSASVFEPAGRDVRQIMPVVTPEMPVGWLSIQGSTPAVVVSCSSGLCCTSPSFAPLRGSIHSNRVPEYLRGISSMGSRARPFTDMLLYSVGIWAPLYYDEAHVV